MDNIKKGLKKMLTKSILWKNIPLDLHKTIRKLAIDHEMTVAEFLTLVVKFYVKNVLGKDI